MEAICWPHLCEECYVAAIGAPGQRNEARETVFRRERLQEVSTVAPIRHAVVFDMAEGRLLAQKGDAGVATRNVLQAHRVRRNRVDRRIAAVGLRTLSTIIFAIALTMHQAPAGAAAEPLTVGGPFALLAPDGTTVTDQTYRGKWLLVYFGYTFCADTCPLTLSEIAAALKKLGPDAANLQPIFITIDPQHDTTEVMGQYTQSFDPRIIGLTGSRQQIDTVTMAYGAYAVSHKTGPGAQDYVMDHSIYIYVMDPQGKFARAFDADWSADRIAAAVRELMTQSRQGESPGEPTSQPR